MADQTQVHNLRQMVDRLAAAAEGDGESSLDDVMDSIGSHSFGPFVLLAGIIMLMPVIGDIPGMPTLMGLLVLLVAGQMLFRRDRLWMPQWMLRRSVKKDKLSRAARWMRPPARFIDRLTKARWKALAGPTATYLIAVVCVIVALALPLMEFIPFSANGAGIAFLAFGLALIVRDGLLSLVAFITVAGTFGFIVSSFL